MAAKKKRTVKGQELDVVVSLPRELAGLNQAQQRKINELAEVFKAKRVYTTDLPSEVMVKMEFR